MRKTILIAWFDEIRVIRSYSIFEFFFSDKNFHERQIQLLSLLSLMPGRIFVAQILNNGYNGLVWLVKCSMVLVMMLSLKLLFCRDNFMNCNQGVYCFILPNQIICTSFKTTLIFCR